MNLEPAIKRREVRLEGDGGLIRYSPSVMCGKDAIRLLWKQAPEAFTKTKASDGSTRETWPTGTRTATSTSWIARRT